MRDLAWSPDGTLFALWVGDRIDIVGADGADRETDAEDAVGGPAWAPDSEGFTYSRYVDSTGQTELGWVDV